MTDLLTTCDNTIAYMIEATGILKRSLGSTLKTTDKEIEMELEMKEALRTTWYWTYKTYREGLDDEKRNGKTPCLKFA